MKRLRALVLLGWHFLLHWLRKVTLLYRRGGIARFRRNYDPDRLLPVSPEGRALLAGWQQCTGCGICDALCPALPIGTGGRNAGLAELMSAGLRDPTHYAGIAADVLAAEACGTCGACEEMCPMGVPIREALRHMASEGAAHADAESGGPGAD